MIIKRLFFIPLLVTLFFTACTSPEQQLLKEARAIHQEILTLDSHTDTPLMMSRLGFDLGTRNDAREGGGKLDFPRMQEGGLNAAFFAVFLGQGESSTEGFAIAKQRALDTYDLIFEALEQNHQVAALALTPEDAYTLKAQGKKAIYIGLENAYPIGEDLSMVERFYDLGHGISL